MISSKSVLAALALTVLSLLALASSASAKVIAEAGEGAGQTHRPNGVAVDFETGRLFVADTSNNRVDVFGPTGTFEKAFGWGVQDGKAKFEVCTSSCREGLSGSGAGQFSQPTAIAVDNSPTSSSRHDVYVVDAENFRIEKFGPEGEFKFAFGAKGEGEGQLSNAFQASVGIGPGGIVYVVDSLGEGGHGQNKARLQRFEPSGVAIAPQRILLPEGPTGSLAVDSSGDFYVTTNTVVRKYAPGGGLPIEEIEVENGFHVLAVDSADDLFVGTADYRAEERSGVRSNIAEYDPAGNPLRRFGYGSFDFAASALAPYHSSGGDIYAAEDLSGNAGEGLGSRVLQIAIPPAGPQILPVPCGANPLGNTKATLNAEVNPEGKATTVHFQYIADADFIANGNSFSGAHPASSTAESESIGQDFELHKASVQAVVEPETKYHCRVVATNADAPAGVEGKEGTFLSKEPFEIIETAASAVGTEAATLNATVNPLGVPTSGYFEYVDDATYQTDIAKSGPGHGFDHAVRAPEGEELAFGAGEAPKLASTQISELEPGTTYHLRIRVDDHLPTVLPRTGPEHTFRTFSPSAGLPDNRAYELVSPAQKNSAEVAIPGPAGGLANREIYVPINAAADSGEAVTYTSWTSFENPEGATVASQYLSRRSPSGWGTENISPFGSNTHPLNLPYRGFSSDLRFGAFVTSEPALTPEAKASSASGGNLYLRDNQTGSLQTLTIEEPQLAPGLANPYCSGYAGASADGSHAIFAGRGAMVGTGALVGSGFSLYEWSAAKGLALVSVLPDGSPAPPVKASTGFGAMGGSCTMDQAPIRHAISADGSTIFWTYGGKYKGAEQPLFARIDGAETIQLDAKPEANPGKGPFGGGQFWAATGDGSKAFFTAPGKLTADAKAAGQLYRYDTQTRSLIDLTPGEVAPQIEGVIGASEDGTYAYFVATGALTGEEESASHQKAVQGASNLYLWHEGEGVRLIARLSELDSYDWNLAPEKLTARITPDGRHLAFLSVEAQALSGYDNTIASGLSCQRKSNLAENELVGDPHCPEAYLYDAEANALTCASCNPSGSRPVGPTSLPSWSNPYEGPRYLSDDGSKLFFESRDVLSAADHNQRSDVYELELAGSGSCNAQSPSFNPSSGGCLFLISSGTSEDETYLVDASANGRDVFFSTRSALTGWDTNENYDVYDAREGGGFPEPSQAPACLGEACKAPPPPVPAGSSPGTPSFQGPGNAVQKPKGKSKKHKKKSKHKAKKKDNRATDKGRARR